MTTISEYADRIEEDRFESYLILLHIREVIRDLEPKLEPVYLSRRSARFDMLLEGLVTEI